MVPPLTPWPASLPSSNKRETLLVESILGLNLVSWGFVNYVSCVSILLAETSSLTVLRLLWGRPGMMGKMESSPQKIFNDFFCYLLTKFPFHFIPFRVWVGSMDSFLFFLYIIYSCILGSARIPYSNFLFVQLAFILTA